MLFLLHIIAKIAKPKTASPTLNGQHGYAFFDLKGCK